MKTNNMSAVISALRSTAKTLNTAIALLAEQTAEPKTQRQPKARVIRAVAATPRTVQPKAAKAPSNHWNAFKTRSIVEAATDISKIKDIKGVEFFSGTAKSKKDPNKLVSVLVLSTTDGATYRDQVKPIINLSEAGWSWCQSISAWIFTAGEMVDLTTLNEVAPTVDPVTV